MTETEALDTAAMFVAGALQAAMSHGMDEKDAGAFALGLYKDAASGRRMVLREDDDEDDEEETFWGKYKWPILATLGGTGLFLLGANSGQAAGEIGKLDRGHFTNALHYLYDASRKILGLSGDPYYNALTKARNYGKKTGPGDLIKSEPQKDPVNGVDIEPNGPDFSH